MIGHPRLGLPTFFAIVVVAIAVAPVAVAVAQPTDVMFVVDTSGSMDSALDDARNEMTDAMATISAQIPDVAFGVAQVRDYGGVYGDSGDVPWDMALAVSTDQSAVIDALNGFTAAGGGDSPEAYGRALYETDVSSTVGWRPGSRRLIVLVADDVPHDLDLNREVPPGDITHSSPWDTGADPGRDESVGTSDDLAWLDVLGRLQRDAVPLLFVFYHGTEDYLPYWRFWAGLTGGEVSAVGVGGAAGHLGDEVASLVQRNATPCAPSLVGGPSPASGRTPQAGTPATTVTLTAPAGTRFCVGTRMSFGGTEANVAIAAGGATASAPIPRKAGQGLTVSLPGQPAPVSFPFTVDSYRRPWGFQFLNSSSYEKYGGYKVTYKDLVAVFGEDAVYLDVPGLDGICHDCLVSLAGSNLLSMAQDVAGGMCFGFSAASMRFVRGDRKTSEFGASTVTALKDPGSKPNDSAIWRYIRQQQISQIAVQITDATKAAEVTTAAANRERLRKAFSVNDRPIVTLGFDYEGKRDGHALVAYDVEDSGAGYDIDVYDPNIPSDAAFDDASQRGQQFDTLKIHVQANGSWTFTGSFGKGTFGDPISGPAKDLRVLPHSVLPSKGLRSPGSWVGGLLAFSARGGELQQVTGTQNRTLLLADGTLRPDAATVLPEVREIPLAIDPGTGRRLELGGRGPYRLDLQPAAGAQELEQHVAGSGVIGSVSVARPVAGSTYAVIASSNAIGVLPATAAASSTLSLVKHTSHGFDRSIVARLASSRARATVSFDAPGGTATLSATAAVSASLTLSQTNGGALPDSATIPVSLRRGERVQLRPSAWSDLTRITATTRTRSGRVRVRRVVTRTPPAGAVRLGTVRASARGRTVKLSVPYRVRAGSRDVTLVAYAVRRSGRVLTRGSSVVKSASATLVRELHTQNWRGATVEVRLTRLSGGSKPASVQARRTVRVRAR